MDYLNAIVDYNQSQFDLYQAIGQPPGDFLVRPANPPPAQQPVAPASKSSWTSPTHPSIAAGLPTPSRRCRATSAAGWHISCCCPPWQRSVGPRRLAAPGWKTEARTKVASAAAPVAPETITASPGLLASETDDVSPLPAQSAAPSRSPSPAIEQARQVTYLEPAGKSGTARPAAGCGPRCLPNPRPTSCQNRSPVAK